MDVVEPDELLDRIDVNVILERIDIDQLLEHIDVNASMARIDVDLLLDRIDVDAMLDRIDVNRMMARVDIDGMLTASTSMGWSSASIDAMVEKAHIEEMISRPARHHREIARPCSRAARRADVILERIVSRFRRKQPEGNAESTPPAPRPADHVLPRLDHPHDDVQHRCVDPGLYVTCSFQSQWKPEAGEQPSWLIASRGWLVVVYLVSRLGRRRPNARLRWGWARLAAS